MRCSDVERLWDEMREGVEPQREHVLAHLRACPECQEIYRENEGIAYCLTCLPPVDPPQRLVPKILEHIKLTVKIVAPDSITTVESPIGRLFVAFRHSGITAVALDRGEGAEAVHAKLQRRLGPRPDPVADAAVGQRHRRELLPHPPARPREGRHQRPDPVRPVGAARRGDDPARRGALLQLDRRVDRPAERRARRRPRDGAQPGRAALPVPPRRRRDRSAAPIRVRRGAESPPAGARRLPRPRPPLTARSRSKARRRTREPFAKARLTIRPRLLQTQISTKVNRRTRGGGHRYYRRSQTMSHDDRRAPDLVRPPRNEPTLSAAPSGAAFFCPAIANRSLGFLAENLGFVSRRRLA